MNHFFIQKGALYLYAYFLKLAFLFHRLELSCKKHVEQQKTETPTHQKSYSLGIMIFKQK